MEKSTIVKIVLLFSLGIASFSYGKQTVAIFPLKNNGGLTEGEVNIFSDRISYEVTQYSQYQVIERAQINQILQEQGFQQSGACSDESCLVQMGQILAVGKIVTGSMGKIGSLYSLNLKIINVSTGEIEKQIMENMKDSKEDIIVKRVPELVEKLFKVEMGKQQQSKSASASEKSLQQNIGSAPAAPAPLLKRPVFWISTGTLLAATAAAVYMLNSRSKVDAGTADSELDPNATMPERPVPTVQP